MQTRANCIVCILRPVIYAGLIGTTPAELTCQHSRKKAKVPSARYSRFWGSLCAFLTVAEVTGLILHIAKHVYYKQKFDFVKDLYWYITYVRVIHILFLGNVMSPFAVKEFNGLISIMEERKCFGISTFFNALTVTYYRKVSVVNLTLIILLQTAYFVTNVFINKTHYEVFENLSTILCSTVYTTTAFSFIFIASVYARLYDVCFSQIKRCLSSRIVEREKLWMSDLIKLTRLYSCLQKNFKLREYYSGAIVVMSFNMFSLMFVFNFLLLTLRLLYEIEMSFLAVLLQLQTICSFFILAVYTLVYENLANSSEEIRSFLFRYPISKLSHAEAAQVEMMIMTLHDQRPILKASDIFTVGTRLLASITGTVVTHVLAALQFHASWAKH